MPSFLLVWAVCHPLPHSVPRPIEPYRPQTPSAPRTRRPPHARKAGGGRLACQPGRY